MCVQKMIDHTFILYNVMFYNQNKTDSCYSKLCEGEKCICIDREQSGLLRKLWSPDDMIAACVSDEYLFFLNEQNPLQEYDLCKDSPREIASKYPLFRNRFFPEYIEILNGMSELPVSSALSMMNVVKTIPILYTTNSMHSFKERESLIYLCKYAPCTETYQLILLRALICKAIGCCQRASLEEKENYLAGLTDFLNRLKIKLEQDDKDMIDQCAENVEMYIQKWNELIRTDESLRFSGPSIGNELQDYLNELVGISEKSSTADSTGTRYNLYLLLKKILQTANLSISDLPELPFENYRNSVGTDYDQVIDILDNVRHDTDKLREIWAILAQVFWRSEDITKEEIEKMMQVADC